MQGHQVGQRLARLLHVEERRSEELLVSVLRGVQLPEIAVKDGLSAFQVLHPAVGPAEHGCGLQVVRVQPDDLLEVRRRRAVFTAHDEHVDQPVPDLGGARERFQRRQVEVARRAQPPFPDEYAGILGAHILVAGDLHEVRLEQVAGLVYLFKRDRVPRRAKEQLLLGCPLDSPLPVLGRPQFAGRRRLTQAALPARHDWAGFRGHTYRVTDRCRRLAAPPEREFPI